MTNSEMKPVVIIGLYSIVRLLMGQDVNLDEVNLIPASDIMGNAAALKEAGHIRP